MTVRSQTHWSSFSRLAAAVPALMLLCACGGGGSSDAAADKAGTAPALEVAPSTFQINPAASWKARAFNDDYYSGSIAAVELRTLNAGLDLPAGTLLQMQSLGSFRLDAAGSLSSSATGVFVDKTGLPLAVSGGTPYPSPSSTADCGMPELGDTYPEDFVIPGAGAVSLPVPAGATALLLSVSDCHYRDNKFSDDPIRVRLTLRPPA